MSVEFVDTNILVYAYDKHGGPKHEIAVSLLQQMWADQNGATSVQVLEEFFVVVTRKISKPIPVPKVKQIIEDFGTWRVAELRHKTVLRAISVMERYKTSFWDAMILASAEELAAAILWSEDLSDGQQYGTVRVQNPFTGMA